MPKNLLKKPKKEDSESEKELKDDLKPPKKKKVKEGKRFSFAFLKDEKLIRVVGLFLSLFSIFLLFSFISFFYNLYFEWGSDELFNFDVSLRKILFNSEIDVHNWMGRLGAFFSFLMIKKGFGIASFVFIFLIFIYGVKLLLKVSLLPLWKTTKYLIFCCLWLSFTVGYFTRLTDYSILGGVFGYQFSTWFIGLAGNIGSIIFILFSLIAFLIIAYNLSFKIKHKEPLVEKSTMEAETETVEDNEETENKTKAPRNIVLNPNISSSIDDDFFDSTPTKADDDVFDSIEMFSIEKEVKQEVKQEEKFQNIELEIETAIDSPIFDDLESESTDNELIPHYTIDSPYDPTLDLSSYVFPSTDLLESHPEAGSEVTIEEIESNKNRIVKTLNNYQIQIDKIKATIGPTVTLYEIVPAPGVRISKIKNLEDDIALSLSALGIRIIAPIPGKGTIGIEVPNQNPQIVAMKTLLNSERFNSSKFDLPIALGKTIQNEPYVCDLAKMPHLLMAGATGQGKSVGLNAIIASLIYKKHPSQLKFVMIDPKKVELTLYSKIERHYLAKLPDTDEAIITDTKKVVRTLHSLTIEMDQRYDLLKDAQVKNIKEYNAKFIIRKLNPNEGHRFMPYIVLVVDEFADLIMTAGKEVELPIARLAQLARAVGIHLVIATQRPSVNIITGTIKANFPARMAFRVTSKIDSRTILDQGGADQLIGRGDMLLSTGNELLRLQCAYIDTPEIEVLTEFIGSQRGYPTAHMLPDCPEEGSEETKEFDPNNKDELFEEAARLIVQHQQGSTSLLQRKLKLGYNRAGRLIDQLESAGIVGPFEGSKAREVKVKTEFELEQYLHNNI
ncbi:MAG: DNA translocase FtsK 4TM domain-containing protein [Bacteroidota bacterium]